MSMLHERRGGGRFFHGCLFIIRCFCCVCHGYFALGSRRKKKHRLILYALYLHTQQAFFCVTGFYASICCSTRVPNQAHPCTTTQRDGLHQQGNEAPVPQVGGRGAPCCKQGSAHLGRWYFGFRPWLGPSLEDNEKRANQWERMICSFCSLFLCTWKSASFLVPGKLPYLPSTK